MIPFQPLQANPTTQAIGQDLIKTGTGVYAAGVSAFRSNPAFLLAKEFQSSNIFERIQAQIDPSSDAAKELGPLLTAEQANNLYGIDNTLSFDKPIYDYDAKLRNENASISAVRNEQVSRAKNGFLNGSLRFGSELLAGIIDPINVASSFIPVVGQARFARLASTLGKGGARLATGFIEGAAGAALLEPAIFALNDDLGLNYGFEDSLTNIGFGGALGGALHFGTPALKGLFNWNKNKVSRAVYGRDVITDHSDIPDLKTHDIQADPLTLKTTVAQLIDGQQIDYAIQSIRKANITNAIEKGDAVDYFNLINNQLSNIKNIDIRKRFLSLDQGEFSTLPDKKIIIDDPLPNQEGRGRGGYVTTEGPVIYDKLDKNISDADVRFFNKLLRDYNFVETKYADGVRDTIYRYKTPDGLYITYKENIDASGNRKVQISSSENPSSLSEKRAVGEKAEIKIEQDYKPYNVSDNLVEGQDFNFLPNAQRSNELLDDHLSAVKQNEANNKWLSPEDHAESARVKDVSIREAPSKKTVAGEISQVQSDIRETPALRQIIDSDPNLKAEYQATIDQLNKIEKNKETLADLYSQAAICVLGEANG